MKLRTEVIPEQMSGTINHGSRIIMLGSCFSDNIAGELRRRLFNVVSNPFGTLFNPASIARVSGHLATSKAFATEDLFQHNGLYHCFDCHSSLSRTDADTMLENLNRVTTDAGKFLREATDVFLTFGTAWIYELNSTGQIVANCHKLPASEFRRRKLSVAEAEREMMQAIENIRTVNPTARIYLTVSPVRHLADGAHGNNLSKSTLLLAADSVAAQTGATYFPSYEIVMDELRDYRFYDRDMCHPAPLATEYIFERFADAFFSTETKELSAECEKLTRRMAHRPMTDNREAIEKFKEQTFIIKQKLSDRYPELKPAMERFCQNIQQ